MPVKIDPVCVALDGGSEVCIIQEETMCFSRPNILWILPSCSDLKIAIHAKHALVTKLSGIVKL